MTFTPLNFWDWLAIILVFLGAINWAAIGLLDFNFVVALFGLMTTITKVIYIIIGVAGIYLLLAASSWFRSRSG